MEECGLLSSPSLILGGDLHLVLAIREVWGSNPHFDPMAGWFRDIFEEANLIDSFPSSLALTWRNGRLGDKGVAKRLDRLLMSKDFISYAG